MLSKSNISNWQAIVLVLFTYLPTTVLFIPSQPASLIFQDAWIAVILAVPLSLLLLYFPLADLGKRYPGKTMVQYCDNVLGKFFGKVFGILFIYYMFQIHCWTIREASDFVAIFLPNTPIVIITISFSIITAYAAYNGIEVIARCVEFLFPIGVFAMAFIGISNFSHIDYNKLLPIMESKIQSIIIATIAPFEWITTGFVFGVITSFVNNSNNLKKIGFISVMIGGLILTIFSLINIMAIGAPILNLTMYPLLSLARLPDTPIIERSEIIFIMFWFTWVLIRIAFFSYASVLCLSQLFNLKDYRFFIIPETILAVAYSIYQYDSVIEMFYLFGIAHPFYLSFQVGLPLIIWITALIRGKVSLRKNGEYLR